MSKNKLAKFADLHSYGNVFEPQMSYRDNVPFEKRGLWKKEVFGNDNPIVLELGCGRGEYTVALAGMFPDRNFIGIDIKGARIWTGATQAIERDLGNVAFLRTEIEMIERMFAPSEVSEIWITFPDPQMKKLTRRLTCTRFIGMYRNILEQDGIINLKTDSNFLFTYTSAMAEASGLPVSYSTDNLYAAEELPQILKIHTHYEEQWLERGITIKYLQFRLPAGCELKEPGIEIEFDSYRSYNRDRRGSLESGK